MHFMPDTEDQDSAAETFWPEGYKQVIRQSVPLYVKTELFEEKPFMAVYEQAYRSKFSDCTQFLEKLADMVAISTENGADNAFDDINDSFLKEAPLPRLRAYAGYFTPLALSQDAIQQLRQVVITEYSQDNIYVYAYGVGYKGTFATFDEYISRIAELVVNGAQNGANDTLENIYRSFYGLGPLAPVRRHPRRLKVW